MKLCAQVWLGLSVGDDTHQLALAPGRRGQGQKDQDGFPRTVLNSAQPFVYTVPPI